MQHLTQTPTQYSTAAKTLHWLVAFLIAAMLLTGWTMAGDNLLSPTQKPLWFVLHKSTGLVLLGLGLFALLRRLKISVPPLPSDMPRWKCVAALVTHKTLYALVIIMPLIGWMLISTVHRPTLFFGLFPMPFLPVLSELPDKKQIADMLAGAHGALAWVIVAVVALHVGAALEHHFIERDDVLLRMTPRFLEKALRAMRGEK